MTRVSPFLEEIFQYLDACVCEDHGEFSKLPYEIRLLAALPVMAVAGYAQAQAKSGDETLWLPTNTLLTIFCHPLRQPPFPDLVIAVGEVADDLAELGLEYAKEFANYFYNFEPNIGHFCRGKFGCYAYGIVDWRRGPDGSLEWALTERGERFVLGAAADPLQSLN